MPTPIWPTGSFVPGAEVADKVIYHFPRHCYISYQRGYRQKHQWIKGNKVIFEIRKEGKIIGVSKLEFGDPPMGIVHGDLIPTQFYFPNADTTGCKLFISETDEEIICGFIAIEDLSQELDEPAITVTILVNAAEDYEKFFKHHLDKYEKQFI